MSFLVSARKYRPIKFNEVVGQSSITTTLKNALRTGKMAQSFLFCGPRGVGKTTCARILAKIINCQNLSPETEPCNTCPACLSFNQSASFNIFELDAASNNSVDDIRSLTEQVRIAPQTGKFKIYIIDEVHMLSQAAFNAFLKTLEEPPSYAVFILATTEKHKIIPTILSRCQIFDFSRIRVADIVVHLQKICIDQQITADADALHIIAQKADGGLRDALSMFDRIAGFSDGNITYDAVLQTLSILDYDYFFKITDALLAQDTTTLFVLFEDILQRGFEGDNLIDGLAGHLRNLLVCKDPETAYLVEGSENLRQLYTQQAAVAPTAFLMNALNIANQCDIQYKASRNKRLTVELALLKMCYANSVLNLATLNPKDLQRQISTNTQSQTPPPPKSQYAPPAAAEKVLKEPPLDMKANYLEKVAQKNESPNPFAPTDFKKTAPPPKPPTANYESPLPPSMLQTQSNAAQIPQTLTPDLLQKAWKEYLPYISSVVARTTLEHCPPRLDSGNIIVVTLYGEKQEELVRSDSAEFLQFLRNRYGIDSYELQRVVEKSKQQDPPKSITNYLPTDQFKEMAKNNPFLLELQKRLGLDID